MSWGEYSFEKQKIKSALFSTFFIKYYFHKNWVPISLSIWLVWESSSHCFEEILSSSCSWILIRASSSCFFPPEAILTRLTLASFGLTFFSMSPIFSIGSKSFVIPEALRPTFPARSILRRVWFGSWDR